MVGTLCLRLFEGLEIAAAAADDDDRAVAIPFVSIRKGARAEPQRSTPAELYQDWKAG